VEPEHDQAIIGFFNNNKARNGRITPNRESNDGSSSEGKLLKIVVNTKFNFDKKLASEIKVS